MVLGHMALRQCALHFTICGPDKRPRLCLQTQGRLIWLISWRVSGPRAHGEDSMPERESTWKLSTFWRRVTEFRLEALPTVAVNNAPLLRAQSAVDPAGL